jgi:heme-degrading monooxygenase HmoA
MNVVSTAGQPGIYAINVFTVRPENQQALIECIRDTGRPGDIPGLVAVSLFRSLDGTQVINHMQWTSREAFVQATASDSAIASTRRRVQELIEGAGPNLYEILTL